LEAERRDFLPSDCCGVPCSHCDTARFCLTDNTHFAPAAVYRRCTAADVMSKGLGAILSTGDSRSVNSKQLRSCRLFLERCWDCPSILLNNCCVPTAKDLPTSSVLTVDWCQSVVRKMASARWDDGACLQSHCLATRSTLSAQY
jgi:hypothetical protein